MPRRKAARPDADGDPTALLLQRDPKLCRLSKQIILHQQRLRRELSNAGWLTYLRLEAVVNQRQFELIDRLLRVTPRGRSSEARGRRRTLQK